MPIDSRRAGDSICPNGVFDGLAAKFVAEYYYIPLDLYFSDGASEDALVHRFVVL
jgi:hypothetical protein